MFGDIKKRKKITAGTSSKNGGHFYISGDKDEVKKEILKRKTHINIGSNFSRTKNQKTKDEIKSSKNKLKLLFVFLFCFTFLGFLYLKASDAKAQIERETKMAQEHIDQAFNYIDQGDLAGAMAETDAAGKNISRVKLLAQFWGQDISYLKSSPYADSKLTASERLLDASYLIVNTITAINTQFTKLAPETNGASGFEKGSKFMFNIEDKQKIISDVIQTSRRNLSSSLNELEKVARDKNSGYEDKVDGAINAINKTLISLDSTETLVKKDLPWLCGMDGKPKNILILFQNNAELRGGSGGSLGSFGIARFVDGKLVGIDFGKNIFKLDQDFEKTGASQQVPETLKYLRGDKTWTLKDSGWAVDSKEAFENVLKFYKLETGEELDGVISVDTTAVINLLHELGPIDMPEYGKIISEENFRATLEEEVHKTYFIRPGGKEENEPKKIIGDMMPKFLSKLFDGLSDRELSTKILASLSKSLKQKDIIFYFKNPDFENRMEKLNYAGTVPSTIGDFLYINNSNIAGEKSSLSMEEKIDLKVNIDSSGKVSNNLILSRKHNGQMILPDGINKNFVRMLIPENSRVVDFNARAGNFEQFYNLGLKDGKYFWLGTEANKEEVNFWMTTEPGNESVAEITYEPAYSLKTNDDFTYILSLQKQPGANADAVNLSLKYPDGFTPTNVKNYDEDNFLIQLNLTLDHDQTIKIKFKKN